MKFLVGQTVISPVAPGFIGIIIAESAEVRGYLVKFEGWGGGHDVDTYLMTSDYWYCTQHDLALYNDDVARTFEWLKNQVQKH